MGVDMVKVRVKNFQSIKDASIKIDGLTVVTGANNSGKTALMRAIRGVFENSPHSSLLRKDEKKIEVELEFEDGQSVVWEKGPKDNSYVINGYKISGVGRGAPEELKELGVYPIDAANNTVWPQVAKQFDGTIFLLNRSGAVLAEALSDVEKVGKLTSALRLSEKDRRSVSSELKIRRKDYKEQEEKVSKFDGFETIEEGIENLKEQSKTLREQSEKVRLVRSLYDRVVSSYKQVRRFVGFDPDILPDKEFLEELSQHYYLVRGLYTKAIKVLRENSKFKNFEEIELPNEDLASRINAAIKKVTKHKLLLEQQQRKVELYSNLEIPELPESEGLSKKSDQVLRLQELNEKYQKTLSQNEEVLVEEKVMKENLSKVQAVINELLGDLGECPICKTPHKQ